KNSTLVLPFPVELLRFLERSTHNAPIPPDSGNASSARAIPDEPRQGIDEPRRGLTESGVETTESGAQAAKSDDGPTRTGQD
ncbi:slipin family protein, partial [Streptomyces sp. E11-3]